MAELERLRAANAELRAENAELRRRLTAERAGLTPGAWAAASGAAVELQLAGRIRERDGAATILALHDELRRLSQQCGRYADALEEARGNFVEMKRLYSELNQLVACCSTPTP
ncbi:uncharacterized protein TM35_000302440 [Trypanosoma theileri]|uniref:Uncharacterized protein n=1 Tax=Trypanosoma theileri TaxID=67003 RepID=A0A1X0NNB7_9TRYP|nr:uncharacterized protein TM35_000302440 [Trypanosoma theileri]ORC86204.1 hypothetical protein TM35_000302440 [Trypanosoma theileri]